MEHFSQFILNHWPLVLSFIGILGLIFINELLGQKNKAKEISPQMAVHLINDEQAVIVDLRDKEAFKKGHIIDSLNASLEDFDKPKMSTFKNKPLILVCAKGLQASTAAAKIRTQGFEPMVLSGGITAWQNASLPLVKKG